MKNGMRMEQENYLTLSTGKLVTVSRQKKLCKSLLSGFLRTSTYSAFYLRVLIFKLFSHDFFSKDHFEGNLKYDGLPKAVMINKAVC